MGGRLSSVNAYFQPRKLHGSVGQLSVRWAWQGEGRVRVNFELIEVLDNDPSPSSTLQQGERRQKTEAIRDYLSD